MRSQPNWCNDVINLELEFNKKILETLKETKILFDKK